MSFKALRLPLENAGETPRFIELIRKHLALLTPRD